MTLLESLSESRVAEVIITRREGRKPLAALTKPNRMSVLMDLYDEEREKM